MTEALCAKHPDKDLWFPDSHSPGYMKRIREAKAICFQCPVQDECFKYALEQRIPDGIFGGFGPSFRWVISRQSNVRSVRNYSTIVNDDRAAAERAHKRAKAIGPSATARELGISTRALYRAWSKHGLGAPLRLPPKTRVSEEEAQEMFDRALIVGTAQTAREFKLGQQTLYRAWKWYGLGTPRFGLSDTGT
jgi:WhiB family redox-sensing transcriptional regulator